MGVEISGGVAGTWALVGPLFSVSIAVRSWEDDMVNGCSSWEWPTWPVYSWEQSSSHWCQWGQCWFIWLKCEVVVGVNEWIHELKRGVARSPWVVKEVEILYGMSCLLFIASWIVLRSEIWALSKHGLECAVSTFNSIQFFLSIIVMG